nr:oligopeptide transporter 7 [Quercus suber]
MVGHLALFFTLPVGVITATTNQMPTLNVITEYIIGYLYLGYPVANICFKVYGFITGAIAPVLVWLAHKALLDRQWIRLITLPVLLGGMINMPSATSVNYISWILIGFASGFIAYRYYRDWWSRHNYVLSRAFDAGLAFMGVLLYLCLGMEHVNLNWWGSDSDGCPLASCPTAQGVVVEGCPVF